MKKTEKTWAAVLLAFAGSMPLGAYAVDYPQRPVRAVVTFVPGGPTDNIVRFLAEGLSRKWGQPVVVENKGGAGGMIGGGEIAKARPDGYTFGLLVTGHTIQPSMQSKLPYDVLKDFAPISITNRAPKLVLARTEFPADNLAQLIELTKAAPEKYGAYGTSGVGSMAHLAMEQVNQIAGARFVHVPYKGGSATLNDLLGGQLPLAVLDLASVLPHVQAGKLKVLAVAGSQRSQLFPEVAIVQESVPGFEAAEWFGLAAPAGTPPEIVEKISADVRELLQTDEAKRLYIDGLGWELVGSTPAQMQAHIASQVPFWKEIVLRAGLAPNE